MDDRRRLHPGRLLGGAAPVLCLHGAALRRTPSERGGPARAAAGAAERRPHAGGGGALFPSLPGRMSACARRVAEVTGVDEDSLERLAGGDVSGAVLVTRPDGGRQVAKGGMTATE